MKDWLNIILIKTYKIIFKEEPTSKASNFIKNLTFIGIGFGISAVLGLVTQILAGRILGPLEYGKYALIQAAASFLCLPMLIGVNTALVKYGAEKDSIGDLKRIISTSYLMFFIFSFISLVVLTIFSGIVCKVLGMSLELFFYAVIFSFFSSLYIIAISIAQGLKKMKILSSLQIIYGISGIVAFLAFVFLKMYSFKAILYASSVNYIMVSILVVSIFHKYLSFSFDKILAKRLFKYGFYAALGSVASIIYFNFDRIAINRFLGSSQVGIYGAYYIAFIASAGFIFNIFNMVFFPMFSGVKDKELMFKKINKLILRISIFVIFFVLMMGIVVIKLYGSKYQFNPWLCLMFTAASFLSLLNGIYYWCMSAVGEKGAKVTFLAAMLAAIVSIILNILLVPVLGFYGAVIAMMGAYLVSIAFILSKRRHYQPENLLNNIP